MKKRVFAQALAMAAISAMGATGMAGVTHASATIMTGTVAKAAATGAKPYDFNGDGYADLALGDPYGKVGTKTSAAPQVISAIAAKTVTLITAWLPGQGAPPVLQLRHRLSLAADRLTLTACSAAGGERGGTGIVGAQHGYRQHRQAGSLSARVPNVTGAPGDGSSALRNALQKELARGGIALADTPSPATYTVEGKVVMGAGKDGKQPITIDWTVSDPDGKKLGTVSQKNEVPQGSLDGTGKTADAAAAAAAQGILKLMPQAQQTTSAN